MTDFANHLDTYVPDRLRELSLPGASIALIENARDRHYPQLWPCGRGSQASADG